MKHKFFFTFLFVLLLVPTQSSGYYSESSLFTTIDDTDYYYTAETSYSTYYIGEWLDIDVELVVDYFGAYSYSFDDITLWVSGEDSIGNIYFEDSVYTGLDIIYDEEGVIAEFDFEIIADFPTTLYILVAADFTEVSDYYDELYEDEWVDMMSLTIRDGERPVSNVDYPGFMMIGSLVLVALLIKSRKRYS